MIFPALTLSGKFLLASSPAQMPPPPGGLQKLPESIIFLPYLNSPVIFKCFYIYFVEYLIHAYSKIQKYRSEKYVSFLCFRPRHFPRGNHCFKFRMHFSKVINYDIYSHAYIYEYICVIIYSHALFFIYKLQHYTLFALNIS